MIGNVRSIVASAAGSLKRCNAARNQPAGCDVVVDSGDSAEGNWQTVEELFPASNRLSCGIVVRFIAAAVLRPVTVQFEDAGSK